jgi:hypothetical protein
MMGPLSGWGYLLDVSPQCGMRTDWVASGVR